MGNIQSSIDNAALKVAGSSYLKNSLNLAKLHQQQSVASKADTENLISDVKAYEAAGGVSPVTYNKDTSQMDDLAYFTDESLEISENPEFTKSFDSEKFDMANSLSQNQVMSKAVQNDAVKSRFEMLRHKRKTVRREK